MKTFTLSTPADIARAVPMLMGFEPTESIVMIALGPRQFHARIDTAPNPDTLVPMLLEPAISHGVTGVILAGYDCELDYVEAVAAHFAQSGIDPIEVCTVRIEGRERVTETRAGFWFGPVSSAGSRADKELALQPQGTVPVDIEEADRDTFLDSVNRGNATWWSTKLTRTLRDASPTGEGTAMVADMLALASWLAGDGAVAWMALDVAERAHADRPSGLHTFMEAALRNAVDPTTWFDIRNDIPS